MPAPTPARRGARAAPPKPAPAVAAPAAVRPGTRPGAGACAGGPGRPRASAGAEAARAEAAAAPARRPGRAGPGPRRADRPARRAENAANRAISADGATRLVVTAYIGIGNRLFIRGSGPGLTWEKGVPLTFVSIGKWRWETNDATAPVKFKLYKNDEIECTALGERSVEPGAQQHLTAAF